MQNVISGETGWRIRETLFKFFYNFLWLYNHSKIIRFKRDIWRKNWAGVEENKSVFCLEYQYVFFFYYQSNFLISLSLVSPMCSKMQALSLWITVNILNLWKNGITYIHLKNREYISQLPESNTATPIYLYSFRNKSYRGAIN